MATRPLNDPDVTFSVDAPSSTGGAEAVTSVSHAGHTLRVYADKAVFCETDGVFVTPEVITNKNDI